MEVSELRRMISDLGVEVAEINGQLEIPIWKTLPEKTPSGVTWEKVFNPESKLVIAKVEKKQGALDDYWILTLVSDVTKSMVQQRVFWLMRDYTRENACYVDGKLALVAKTTEDFLLRRLENNISETMVAFPNMLSRYSDPGWFYNKKKERDQIQKQIWKDRYGG